MKIGLRIEKVTGELLAGIHTYTFDEVRPPRVRINVTGYSSSLGEQPAEMDLSCAQFRALSRAIKIFEAAESV